jgi:hypothetical protein
MEYKLLYLINYKFINLNNGTIKIPKKKLFKAKN